MQEEEEILPAPLQGLSDRSWGNHPPFTPLFPLQNPSRPPTAAPPPPRRKEAKPGPAAAPRPPTPRRARTPLSVAHSPIKMRICFLPKRREKREEMVRPMAVAALAMGWSRRGLVGASPGLLPSRSRQKLSEVERGERRRGRQGGGSQAGAPGDAPGPGSAGRGPARRLPRQLRLEC